ncbi:MAG: glycosyltransferase family 2 protein [Chlamydiia bacterium]|nr:glycosyltransferase family 2 protein [Chlamydiia bacterium]
MTISVVLPNYNHALYLPQALKAIFAQSLLPNEVIIIDDASTDNSLSLIKKWQDKHPQIKLFQNKITQGPISSINQGIRAAKSDYLAFCSADDFVLSGFFEKAKDFLDIHPEIGLCTGNTCHFNNNSSYLLSPDQVSLGEVPQIFSPEELLKIFRKTTFFIHSNCTLYRKKYVEDLGGLNPRLKSYGDWHLNCQIALKYGIGYIPSFFGAFRLSDNSYAKKIKNSPELNKIFQTLMEEIEMNGLAKIYKSTGLIAQGGIQFVLFLAKTKQYRHYFPLAFIKKCHFHLNTLLKKKNLPKMEDLDSILYTDCES